MSLLNGLRQSRVVVMRNSRAMSSCMLDGFSTSSASAANRWPVTKTNVVFNTVPCKFQRNVKTMSSMCSDEKYEDTVQKIRAVFDEMDEDNNGYLDIVEIGYFLKKTTGKAPSLKELNYMVNQVDENKDEKVSFDELLLLHQSMVAPEITNLLGNKVKVDGDFEDTTFLVIPSTGNVGFLVARGLGEVPNFKVKFGIRKTSNKGIVSLVKDLAEELEGCETVEVCNSSISSLTAAMEGVDKVLAYCPTKTISSCWADDISNVIEAAKTANVGCVYWITGDNTVLSQDGLFGITRTEQEEVAEKCAEKFDMPLVNIKPNNLTSNIYHHRETIMKQSAIYLGYKPNEKTVITDPVDVAQLTCTVMSQPIKTHAGKTYFVTGSDPITFDEIARKLADKMQVEEIKGRRRVENYLNLVNIFKEADTDNNGFLSFAELTSLLEKIDIPADKVTPIFEEADANGDQQLSCEEFVNSIGKFYDRKNDEAADPIQVHTLSEEAFRGYMSGVGWLPADIDCMVSLYSDFSAGMIGRPHCVKTQDFEQIVGRKPRSFDDWLEDNIGGFMPSHWDHVFSRARQDLIIKAAFQ